MEYARLVGAYENIDATTKRLEMTGHLVELFRETPPDLIDRVVYLSQGKLYPDFVGIEMGMDEKLAIRSLSLSSGYSESKIESEWKRSGDLGLTAAEVLKERKQVTLFREPLTVEKVYGNLEKIARATGPGSQYLKVKLLADLLGNASPDEAKYVMKAVTGKLRLGVADMTILDALAIAFADAKEARSEIERAYNLSSDLGMVAGMLAKHGLGAIKDFKITVGKPIRPMLAERLTSIEEIIEKTGGRCAAEYKYDGLRVQAHVSSEITLFSRRLENITGQFPDVCDALLKSIRAKEAIVEGECVPVNVETGEMLPFQQISHRRGRKHGVREAVEEFPVILFLFDCLYVDGEDLTGEDLLNRRERLKEIVEESARVKISDLVVTDDPRVFGSFFEKAIGDGCEGLLAKSIGADSRYRAGARGWQWIKYKRDYKSEMIDTIDLVAVGAFAGRGRRTGTYGALLMAAYDPDEDVFKTVCKLGAGFDDETLAKLPTLFKEYLIEHTHPRVRSELKPDYWLTPSFVLEVLGAEITLSPIHTCGLDAIREGSGLAIRFPRFTGTWRDDKSPEDATTVQEVVEMYERQLKRV
ncbi:MAG: ATP-dependent DNA ligase [Methanocellales archaeon]|nr:ATP-dependent DNA ligase [Methanocellales archaeon]MDI6903733.1 ATP-dependent DNA ligase [Methanocellales archaeon]